MDQSVSFRTFCGRETVAAAQAGREAGVRPGDGAQRDDGARHGALDAPRGRIPE